MIITISTFVYDLVCKNGLAGSLSLSLSPFDMIISQVRETSDEEIEAIEKEKKIIYAITPHGVMSISGICAAINMVRGI